MDHSNIWNKTKSVLKNRLPAHAFETWFEPIKPLNINGTKLVLQVPNQFFSEWVDMHYRKHIVSTLERLGAGPREIKYVVSTDANNQLEKTNSNIAVERMPKKTPSLLKQRPKPFPNRQANSLLIHLLFMVV